MKILLGVCILIFCTKPALSQIKRDTSKIKIQIEQADDNYVVNSDSVIKEYVDSIEQISRTNRLPVFLYNSCFAEELPIIVYHHSNIDFRWEIIKRVKSKKSIKMILSNGDNRLKEICGKKNGGSINQEYTNLSVYELCKILYSTL